MEEVLLLPAAIRSMTALRVPGAASPSASPPPAAADDAASSPPFGTAAFPPQGLPDTAALAAQLALFGPQLVQQLLLQQQNWAGLVAQQQADQQAEEAASSASSSASGGREADEPATASGMTTTMAA